MITLMSGYGYTGSSAFNALLEETKGCKEFGDELRFLVDPDGFVATEALIRHAWNPFVADITYKRLKNLLYTLGTHKATPYYNQDHSQRINPKWHDLVDQFLGKIRVLDFQGMWLGINTAWDYQRRHINKFLGGKERLNLHKEMYLLTSDVERFVCSAKEFIEALIAEEEATHLLLDEGFASLNPLQVLAYFDEAKVLISQRDPRDVYCEIRSQNARFIPHGVEDFIQWYRAVRGRNQVSGENPRVKTFRFEELVLCYDETVESIFNFLGISKKDHLEPKSIFDPSRSRLNIGKWKKSPYQGEGRIIGKELSEFCSHYAD